jgi:ABC-2 type transport system ATP-binding protein
VTAAPDVAVRDLSVTYRRGQVRALDSIDVSLPAGMVGLLGPNGAGKTTLMRVLAGVLRPSSGTVTVDGADISQPAQRRSVQATLGYLPQELGLYPDLNARQFLDYLAILKGITDRHRRAARVGEVLELVALDGVAARKLKTYSGGMKRRVGIAQAILNDPSLLIVDEPTAGLDPEERLRFRNLLSTLAGSRTVLLSTHIVDDIVQACPHVVVVDHGSIAYQGATSALAAQAEGTVWLVTRAAGYPAPDLPVVAVAPTTTATCYRVLADGRPEPDAQPAQPTVEDGYVALMHTTHSLQRRVRRAA